ncbi:MAG: hypothetical protein IJP54_06085 [Synergistaceae bacterium]|nr:hypothetical protein [Synergistaceae bacterium]MBR0035225.1 hypothetical protein [Synergistaceae bacterium]
MKLSIRKITVVLALVMVFTSCSSAFAWSWKDLNPAAWSRKTIVAVGCVVVGGVYSLGRGAYKAYAAPRGRGKDAFVDGCKEGAKEAWEVGKILF